MFEIVWSQPYKVYSNGTVKYRREWKVPKELLSGFFNWWRRNKFKLFIDGYYILKKNNEWFLTETQPSVNQFKKLNTSENNKDLPPEDNFILKPSDIKYIDGLRDWQCKSVSFLVSSINHWGSAIDGSGMGTGKTYSAIGTVRELNCSFVVVCPKAVISQWQNVINNHFKLKDKCVGIINYESLIRGHSDSNIASNIKRRKTNRVEFTWKLPKNSVIIWDEAHKLKNWKTKNSKTCISAYKQGYRQLFLSASIATTPLELRTIGTCLKLFKTSSEYYTFLSQHGCSKGMWGMVFNNDKAVLERLHKNLFDKRGIRLDRDAIPNFPECEVQTDPFNLDEESTLKINEIYAEMHKELNLIDKKLKKDGENELTIRLRAREKAEMVKIPLIQEMVEDSVEAGMSVVVFLNFSASIDALSKRLNTKCIFDGRTPNDVRELNKQRFQDNKERVIIVNSAAGGAGLSIGDEHGGYPRISLISPDDSAFKMKQVQGRTHRENSKSKSIVRFIFISGTIEEQVANNVKQKLSNLDLLNDDDVKL